jgi:hypothetical protein
MTTAKPKTDLPDLATIKRAIAKIRLAGFTFELIDCGLFYIRPPEQLTDIQRQFLTNHAEQITDFLYSEQNAPGTQQ